MSPAEIRVHRIPWKDPPWKAEMMLTKNPPTFLLMSLTPLRVILLGARLYADRHMYSSETVTIEVPIAVTTKQSNGPALLKALKLKLMSVVTRKLVVPLKRRPQLARHACLPKLLATLTASGDRPVA